MSLNSHGSVYQGTELFITCTATVDSAVDTEVNVNISWASNPEGIMDGSFLTFSGISGSGLEYNSTVTISPVNTTDSANYTCTASITPPDTDYIIPSSATTASVNITVEGKSHCTTPCTSLIVVSYTEQIAPVVYEENVTSTAGQPLSIQCNFTMIPNLVDAPIVQWLSSTGSVVSNTNTFTLSPLLTSHGGSYNCIVNISIPKLDILLIANGNTTVIVESEFSAQLVCIYCDHIYLSHTQFLLHLL